MKKRLVSTMLATVMAFSLVACGSSNEPQETPAAEEAPAQEEAAVNKKSERKEEEAGRRCKCYCDLEGI